MDREHFDATCVVTRNGEVRMYQCRLDNNPTKGYWNRWTITFYGADNTWLETPEIADWVRADVTQQGFMTQTSLLWGEIIIVPHDPALKIDQALRWKKLQPRAFESRPQRFTCHNGVLETVETIEDSDGLVPTAKWLDRMVASWHLYGNVKPQSR